MISTRVGGVPEVLPDDMIQLAEPDVSSLSEAIDKAIQIKRDGHQLDVWEAHHRVKGMYNWCNIAERTEKVLHIDTNMH